MSEKTADIRERESVRKAPAGREPFEVDPDILAPVHYIRRIIERAVDMGLDGPGLLKSCGIDLVEYNTDGQMIAAEKYCRLLVLVGARLNDEALGFGPARVPVGTWFFLCHSLINCETLGEALDRLCRFHRLFESGFQPFLTVERDVARVEFKLPDSQPDFQPEFFVLELLVFTTVRLMNWLICEYVPLKTLSYTPPRPAHWKEIDQHFVVTLLQFDAPTTNFTFDRRFLNRRLQQNQETLERLLKTGYVELFYSKFAPASWSSRIQALIGRALPEIPEFEDIAERFAIHPQTLRRRLAEEGTTFRELKVDVRREAALLLLQSSQLSVEDISTRVGFSEPSAFARAFKQWAGVPPHTFRERL